MARKLPNGLNRFESNDYVRMEHFNEQWETIDNAIGTLRSMDEEVKKEFQDDPPTPIKLKTGFQVVYAATDSAFKMHEIQGRTLINLLGKAGRGDSTQGWTSGGLTSDKESFRAAVPTGATFGDSYYKFNYQPTLNFVAIAEARTSKTARVRVVEDNGAEVNAAVSSSAFAPYVSLVEKGEYTGTKPVYFSIVVQGVAGDEAYFKNARIYAVTDAEFALLKTLTAQQIAERYPYVDGMSNVVNPYAQIIGSNLCPPFYEFDVYPEAKVTKPYELSLHATQGTRPSSIYIPVVVGEAYTLTYDVNDLTNAYMNWAWCDKEKKRISWTPANKIQYTEIAPANAVYMELIATCTVAGTFVFRNPMVVVGTKPHYFQSQQKGLYAVECELASHPIDGSRADQLFTGENGLPYVLEKWSKVPLNSEQEWSCLAKPPGLTEVRARLNKPLNDLFTEVALCTKFDGKPLTRLENSKTKSDLFGINDDTGEVFVTIANEDSGWGEKYTPSVEDIKAYFLGYQMGHWTGNVLQIPYEGTGTKGWRPLTDSTSGNVQQLDAPIVPATVRHPSFGSILQPYKLQYLKVKPSIEPVLNYEIGVKFFAGMSMVEVGSGIVIREKSNPKRGTAVEQSKYVYLNKFGSTTDIPDSPLFNRVDRFVDIYRNGFKDSVWRFGTGWTYGRQKAYCLTSDFDPTAVYHATYTMINPSLNVPISGAVATNLSGTVSDLVQSTSDIERRLSVVENQKAEKNQPQTPWIKATALLNKWVAVHPTLVPKYKKVGKHVSVRGRVTSGAFGARTPVFILPEGYRPKDDTYLSVFAPKGTDGHASKFITIHTDGMVVVEYASDYVQLDFMFVVE